MPASDAISRILMDRRARYFDEIDKDPRLASYIRGMLVSENAAHPAGILERLVNGADMNNRASLWDEIKSGFYGPVNRGEVRPRDDSPLFNTAFTRVRNGSNDINLMTDQGLRNEHKPAAGIGVEPTQINGEWYSPMGQRGLDWAAAVERDARQRGGSMNGGFGMSPTGAAGVAGPAQTADAGHDVQSQFSDMMAPAQTPAPSPSSVPGAGGMLDGLFAGGALPIPGLGSGFSSLANSFDKMAKASQAAIPRAPSPDIPNAQKPHVDIASIMKVLANRKPLGV